MSLFRAFLKAPSSGSLFSLTAAQIGVCITPDLAYGDHARHRLDVYSPLEQTSSKAIVLFIYGGGWDSGERQMYGFVGGALAARGYLTIIPDYRLFPEVRYPSFMTDVSRAYRWTVTRTATEIRAGVPVILMGHSAGAHMSALLAYDPRYLNRCGGGVVRPDGFIGLSGPYGFDAKAHERSRDIFATARSEHQVKPIAQVQAGAPPALLLHGKKDKTVLTLNAIRLRDALQAVGSNAKVVEYEHAGHIALLLALTRPYDRRYKVLPLIDQFIATINDGTFCG